MEAIIAQLGQLGDFLGQSNNERLNNAETRLKVKFPDEYRLFLSRLSVGDVEGVEIYGLVPEASPFPDSVPNMVWLSEDLRANFNLPHSAIPIGDQGDGGFFVIESDPESPDWGSVSLWYGDDNMKPIAASFSEYLIERIPALQG